MCPALMGEALGLAPVLEPGQAWSLSWALVLVLGLELYRFSIDP